MTFGEKARLKAEWLSAVGAGKVLTGERITVDEHQQRQYEIDQIERVYESRPGCRQSAFPFQFSDTKLNSIDWEQCSNASAPTGYSAWVCGHPIVNL